MCFLLTGHVGLQIRQVFTLYAACETKYPFWSSPVAVLWSNELASARTLK